MAKKWVFFLLVFFLLIGIVNAVDVEDIVEEKLQDSSEVSVIVVLKDESIQESKSMRASSKQLTSRRDLLKQRLEAKKEMIRNQQEKVLSRLNIAEKGGGNFSTSGTNKMDIKLRHKYSTVNGFSGKLTREGLEKLMNDPGVKSIFFDKPVYATLDQSIPQINADDVWGIQLNSTNITGAGETICIIDTGVDYNHSDLGNGWGNKVIGGYRSLNNRADVQECGLNHSACFDDEGHGTHVAGIVSSDNETYKGVASDAKIIAIKALDSNGEGYISDVMAGIDWCVNNASEYNISVISMSLGDETEHGSYCNDDVTADSINSAVGLGILVAVSAGNCDWGGATCIDGPSAPACVENATPVGSVTHSDTIAYQRGDILNILAPGGGGTDYIHSTQLNGGFTDKHGTSMAAPHVAGAAALIKQFIRLQNGNDISPQEIEDVLNATGVEIDDSGGSGRNYSRIDVYAAILSLDTTPPNVTFVDVTPENNTVTSNTSIIVNVTVVDYLNNISSCVLEWDSTNESMTKVGSGASVYCHINKSINESGIYYYRVYANDSSGNMGGTDMRVININNAPNITSFYPNVTTVSMVEPQNQTFNITYSDANNDTITVTWYLNGSNVSNLDNYTFLGNYSAAGNYNITVIISDGIEADSMTWNLTVNNTNRFPTWEQTLENQTIEEDTNLNYDINATDPDGEDITYYVNDTNFIMNSTTGELFFSPAADWHGLIWLTLTASDSVDNITSVIYVNVTPVNDAPVLATINNITVNESSLVNMTANATDVDNVNLNYSINDSRFTKQANNVSFVWQTTYQDYGIYHVRINVTDTISSDYQDIVITVLEFEDADNDGINNSIDYLEGDSDSINSSTTITVYVNDSSNLSKVFNETYFINITNTTHALVEFNWTFGLASKLNLSNITINKQSNTSSYGSLLIKGLDLAAQNNNKTVYVDDVNASLTTICIKDAEITSIDDISSGCNGTNETLIECNSTLQSGYNCTDMGAVYKINGVVHSGIKEQCADNDGDGYGIGCAAGSDCDDNDADKYPGASCSRSCYSGSTYNSNCECAGGTYTCGGGSSGSSVSTTPCTESWNCTEWSECKESGIQTRNCIDENNCETMNLKPDEMQTCIIPKTVEEKNLTQPEEVKGEIEEVPQMESITGAAVEEEIKETENKIVIGVIAGVLIVLVVISLMVWKRSRSRDVLM